MQTKLRVVARGDACFPDPHGADSTPQRRRMVGREYKQIEPGTFGWVPSATPSEPEEMAYHHDIAKAVRDGDLWPADEETAKACGVKFDKTFGGAFDAAPKTTIVGQPDEIDNLLVHDINKPVATGGEDSDQ